MQKNSLKCVVVAFISEYSAHKICNRLRILVEDGSSSNFCSYRGRHWQGMNNEVQRRLVPLSYAFEIIYNVVLHNSFSMLQAAWNLLLKIIGYASFTILDSIKTFTNIDGFWKNWWILNETWQ